MAEKQVKDYDKFNLRFPDGMRDAIAERAKQNGRSMNSEIVARLNATLQHDSSLGSPTGFMDVAEFLEASRKRVDALESMLSKGVTLDEETAKSITYALERATEILKKVDSIEEYQQASKRKPT